MVERRLIQGDEACAQGAIAAGCRFFGGYPISPSSEIAEYMARELPRHGGVFIQMEDELSSLGSVLGASLAGAKSMTATSGPGFTLMQEHLGYATLAEIPCVVVDVMRLGPSTGLPTSPSQGDVMQAKWGSHGDRSAVALAPGTVKEIYDLTIRAFDVAERLSRASPRATSRPIPLPAPVTIAVFWSNLPIDVISTVLSRGRRCRGRAGWTAAEESEPQ